MALLKLRRVILSMKYFLVVALVISSAIFGQTQSPKDVKDANERINESSALLAQYLKLGDTSLPVEYLKKAKAIAFFPGTRRYSVLLSELLLGNGVIATRSGSNWNSPVFVSLKGSDISTKFAGKKTFDVVILFMDDVSLDRMKKKGVTFASGGETEIRLGPVVKGDVTDKLMRNAQLLYYTFESGQVVDIPLKNNWLTGAFGVVHNNGLNRSIFGFKTRDILMTPEKVTKTHADVRKNVELFREKLSQVTTAVDIGEPK